MASTIHPQPRGSSPQQLLVGRDQEIELLRQRLEASLSGNGGFVLISGEAGIGKTALCEALARDAVGQGALVLTGHCFDLITTPPYGPWLDLLSGRADEAERSPLLELLKEPSRLSRLETQGALFVRVAAFFTSIASRRPVMLILEDLHWADVASIDLLRFVARRVASQPILLLATYRVDDLTRRHPLFQRLPALVREAHAIRIDLKRLDRAALRDLIRSRYQLVEADDLRLVDYLDRHSEGNPFYASELLRAIEDESILMPAEHGWGLGDLSGLAIPPLVLQMIETRLSRLPERTRRLLAVAAVIGQEVPFDIWTGVSEATDEELADVIEQATDAHLLVETPGGSSLRFAHALVREALHAGIALPRRRIWSQRIAEALARQPQPDPDLVAYHFQQAMDPRAAEWLIRAGERAQALYAPHAAIACFTRALHLTEAIDVSQQMACRRARGRAHETIGEFTPARADYETALTLARDGDDRQAQWHATLDLGMLWASRSYTRSGMYYEKALELARTDGEPRMIAHSLNRLGNWYMNLDQPAVSKRYHDEALTHFRALGDRRGMAETLDLLGATMSIAGNLEQTSTYFREAIDLFQELDDRHGLSSALATSGEQAGAIASGALIPSTTLPRSQASVEAALQIARDIGWRSGEAYALLELGIILSGQGEFGRAWETLREALQVAEEIEHRQWQSVSHAFLGDLYVRTLAAPQAREQCEQGIELARQVGSVVLERLASVFLALALAQESEMAEAQRLLGAIEHDEPSESMTLTQIAGRLTQADRALAQSQPDVALLLIDLLLARIPNVTPDRIPTWLAIIRGEALTELGRGDEAEAILRMAIRDSTSHGARPLLWRAHLALGALYQAQGRTEAAQRHFADARAIVKRLAGTIPEDDWREHFLWKAEDRLALILTRSTSASSPRAFSLSNREIEVLRLVAEGLTDAQVAERLYVSRRTVTSHLTSIYNKLGVSTRTAAARLATEHDIS